MKRSLLFLFILCLLMSGCNRQKPTVQSETIVNDTSQESSISQSENWEKQEITLAFLYENAQMQAVVDAFNAQSTEYQVKFVTYVQPGEMALGKMEEIEKELKSGKGPDILQDGIVDLNTYVKKGYLQPLDGVVQMMIIHPETIRAEEMVIRGAILPEKVLAVKAEKTVVGHQTHLQYQYHSL